MKTSKLKYVSDEGVTTLFIPFHDKEVRVLIDTGDLALIQNECCSINIHRTKRENRYPRVYTNDRKLLYLHRLFLGLENGDPRFGDHKNTDTLDCRRENLRITDVALNSLNHRAARGDSVLRLRCVGYSGNGWHAIVRKRYLGCFRDVRDAVEAAWLGMLELDPIAATNYLRSLPNDISELAERLFPGLLNGAPEAA